MVKRTARISQTSLRGAACSIATPCIVDDYIRHFPPWGQAGAARIHKDLAVEYGADYTRPVTTGIFLPIVSEAAYERLQSGAKPKEVTPFWRAVGPNSPTAKKLSVPLSFIIEQRKREGIE